MDKNAPIEVKYASVLEDYYILSQKHIKLQEKFETEYNFCEQKIQEIGLFHEFIDSNEDIKKSFDEFMKSKLPKQEGSNNS